MEKRICPWQENRHLLRERRIVKTPWKFFKGLQCLHGKADLPFNMKENIYLLREKRKNHEKTFQV